MNPKTRVVDNYLLYPSPSPIIKTITCPECSGTGEVTASYEFEDGCVEEFKVECPNCNGIGELESWR